MPAYIVEIADDWTGATLEVVADTAGVALTQAIARFAADREASGHPVGVGALRARVTRKGS